MNIDWDDYPRNKPGEVVIYGLIDPKTNVMRYVGQTVNPEARYKQHVSTDGKQCNPEKARWINTLLCEGLEPHMSVMAVVQKKHAYDLEMLTMYIVKAKLTNSVLPTDRQIDRILGRLDKHEVWGPILRDAGIIR